MVFGFGILMSFTPCIYPMIPITLAVIGAQSTDKGVAKGFLLALTYGLGLALVYAVIGAVSATVFSGVTAFLQSPVVLVPIALLMFGLSFAMFGAYELQAPAFLRNRLQGPGGNRAGVFGALVMGMIAGLVASPCVGPFLGALLLWVGTTGSIGLGFWTLFVFGLGLSVLLVVVGTFPAAMGSLPQSGGWMDTVKKGMGLLLVFMAFFFLRPGLVLPAKIFYPLLGAVTVVVATFMGAFDRLGRDQLLVGPHPQGPRPALPRRRSLAPRRLLGPLWLAAAATEDRDDAGRRRRRPGDRPTPRPLPSPPPARRSPRRSRSRSSTPARTSAPSSTRRSPRPRRPGQPVVIDFWATWCKVCQVLDKKVWVDPAVIAESARFHAGEDRLHGDGPGDGGHLGGVPGAAVCRRSRSSIAGGRSCTGRR